MFTKQIREGLKTYEAELNAALSDLSIGSNRDTLTEKLNSISEGLDGIDDLVFSVVFKNNKPFLLFRYTGHDDEPCKGGVKLNSDTLDKDLVAITNAIYNGASAVKYLNSKLDDIRSHNGIILDIKYKWGYSEHAHIADWTYDSVVVRLSRSAINKLSSMTKKNMTKYIDDITDGLVWEYNIAEYVTHFNDFNINSKLGLVLKHASTADSLSDNMLTYDDIVTEVKKNLGNDSGVQYLKSISILNELGVFAAIVSWSVDYKDKDATASILGDKVIDLENLIFVSDHSLYSRIEQRILSASNELTNIMRGKAS